MLLRADRFQGPIAYQFLALLIPQPERKRLEAAEQSHRFDGLEKRFRPVALLQVIVRNARAQVVDVVKPDVARESLEHLGQLVE